MIKQIKTVIKYYRRSFILEVKSLIAYPAVFWMTSLTVPIWSFVQVLFIETIFANTSSFLGYSKYESYLLVGVYKAVQSLVFFFFYVRLEDLTAKVRGVSDWSLDTMLLKPLDSQIFVTTGRFWFGSLSSFIVAVSVIIYSLIKEPKAISLGNFLGFIFVIFLAVILLYIIYLVIQTLVFWFEYLQVGESLFISMQTFGKYPRQLYQGGLGLLFNVALPVTLMAAVPVEFLLGKTQLPTLLFYSLVVVILFFLSLKFWHFSLKNYSSFSS
jgi:ABC-2 type transport system permease protein